MSSFQLCKWLFPGLVGVACDWDFLYLLATPLPPKPWPKTIGGMSVRFYPGPYLRSDQLASTGKMVSVRNGRLARDINYRDVEDWDPLFHIIKEHFNELAISITEVVYKRDLVSIVLEYRNINISRVPAQIAQVTCNYLFEDEMGRPTVTATQARQQHNPSPGNPDERLATLLVGDVVYLESPNAGCLEGQIIHSARQRRPPSDDAFANSEQEWLFRYWIYMGQDSATNMSQSMCGSAMWKTNGDVVDFFQNAPQEGVVVDYCASFGERN